MFRYLTPHLQLESILELEVADLQARGLRGLLLDVDGTLKDHRAPAIPAPVAAWVGAARTAGVRLCVLSNGCGGRIGPLADGLQVPHVCKAFKPLPWGCRRALEKLELRPDEAAVVGDQVFADVLAGRLAGLLTILVRPSSFDEPWFTRLKRPAERWVLRRVKAPIGAWPAV
jgi:HAD superfamily phosphatase (TIGR01668 family)